MRKFDKQWAKRNAEVKYTRWIAGYHEDGSSGFFPQESRWYRTKEYQLIRQWYEPNWHRYHHHHSERYMQWLRLGREMAKTPGQHTAEAKALRDWVREKMLIKY